MSCASSRGHHVFKISQATRHTSPEAMMRNSTTAVMATRTGPIGPWSAARSRARGFGSLATVVRSDRCRSNHWSQMLRGRPELDGIFAGGTRGGIGGMPAWALVACRHAMAHRLQARSSRSQAPTKARTTSSRGWRLPLSRSDTVLRRSNRLRRSRSRREGLPAQILSCWSMSTSSAYERIACGSGGPAARAAASSVTGSGDFGVVGVWFASSSRACSQRGRQSCAVSPQACTYRSTNRQSGSVLPLVLVEMVEAE